MSNGSRGYGPGTRINDRYTVVQALSEGKDGQVYIVTDEYLMQDVALKILKPKSGQPATWDEAQLLVQLQSEFLVRIYNADILHPSDLRYITTELMVDGDLQSNARPTGVNVSKARKWGIEVAHALHRVHADGLVHRDVKPQNAFLDASGGARLGDLGSAYRLDQSGRAPAEGTFVTVAPEVLTSDRCSVASDIYSLGATICYLLTGQYPVDNTGDLARVRQRVLSGDTRRVRDLGPHISQSLGQVVERCLDPDPARRPASAHEAANLLATASVHRRDWRLLPAHNDHFMCLEGSSYRSKQPVDVCAVAITGARCNIEVRLANGSHVRRREQADIRRLDLPARLRELCRVL